MMYRLKYAQLQNAIDADDSKFEEELKVWIVLVYFEYENLFHVHDHQLSPDGKQPHDKEPGVF